MDDRIQALLADGDVRALRVDVTGIALEAASRHDLGAEAERLCTEGIAAAALLSAYLDDDERLTLQIQGSEPRFALTVDVTCDGGVRARFTPSDLPSAERLQGVMLVLKSVVGREVYRGASEVDHATIGEVLQAHLDQSTQAAARVRVRGPVGAFVERMPGGDPAIALDTLVADVAYGLEGGVQKLRWECSCSDERVLGMLASLGDAEVRAMIDEDGGAVVTCHFCTRRVEIGVDALRGLLTDA